VLSDHNKLIIIQFSDPDQYFKVRRLKPIFLAIVTVIVTWVRLVCDLREYKICFAIHYMTLRAKYCYNKYT